MYIGLLPGFPKIGAECEIEVQIQAITGEERDAAGGQEVSQGVDDAMRCVLCAGAHMQDRKNFRAGVDGQPQPKHLGTAAEPCAQFIQLHVRELEVARCECWCNV